MEITKKVFKKLKKLDRIEYLIRRRDIKNKQVDPDKSILVIVFLASILLISISLWQSLKTGKIMDYTSSIVLLLKIGLIGYILTWVMSIISSIVINKKLKELDEEYFKLIVKNK